MPQPHHGPVRHRRCQQIPAHRRRLRRRRPADRHGLRAGFRQRRYPRPAVARGEEERAVVGGGECGACGGGCGGGWAGGVRGLEWVGLGSVGGAVVVCLSVGGGGGGRCWCCL